MTGIDPPFGAARVERLRDLSPSVREFTLRPGAGVQPWRAGSHLQVQAGPHLRCYSLVGLPRDDVYCIAVKRVAASRGGSRFMWNLHEGDLLPVSAPLQHFEMTPQERPTVLVAGGIGITPLLGMALQPGAGVRLLYAVRQAADLVYGDELRAALGERLQTFVSSAGQRLDLHAVVATLEPDARLLVCGPVGLLQAAQSAWARAGRPAALLRFETFGSGGAQAAQPFRARLPRHGLEIEVPADRTLLDELEARGIAVLSDCRKGECGLCTLDVVSTDAPLDHRDVFFSAAQRERGDRLCACVSRACGGTVVLDTAYRP